MQTMREFPEEPMVAKTGAGSFDCIGVREANADFAQDDDFRVSC
jgi:hypothetical protein